MYLRLTASKPVFFTAAALLIAFGCLGIFGTALASHLFSGALEVITEHFGWVYVFSTGGFIGFVAWLAASRHGRLVLGKEGEKPEFSNLSWSAMLFSAGMGIGLLYFGVAEPVMHFANPPHGEGGTPEAARLALPLTFFHWGIHGWAIYAVLGLGVAYFSFRKGLPLSIRSVLYPLIGEGISGPLGHLVDILAVFGTLFGLATSLGVGAMQLNAGLGYLAGVPQDVSVQLLLIALITMAATLSVLTGIEHGIRRLSELNMVMAGLLLLFVFCVGPSAHLVSSFFANLLGYVAEMVPRTFYTASPAEDPWHSDWTLYYWGWWMAWAPFVGIFVARISRGRTIRQFLLGVVLVPTLVTFIWMTVFGNTALWLEQQGGGIAEAVSASMPTAIYVLLDQLPLGGISSILAAVVVTSFFITSSDSASYVIDMLTAGGHPDPPRWQRVFWAISEGGVAAVLLYSGGRATLKALQSAVISVGLPLCIVLLLTCVGLAKALRQEGRAPSSPLR